MNRIRTRFSIISYEKHNIPSVSFHSGRDSSRTLALCQRRLSFDWQERFGHPLLLLETFIDPTRFQGTLYKASSWLYVGDTQGFRRTQHGYCVVVQ